jgi:hypothetical protein
MALFSKESETNSRPEHSHEPSQSPAALAIQLQAGENVAPARDAASTLREAGVAPRKPAFTDLHRFPWLRKASLRRNDNARPFTMPPRLEFEFVSLCA